MPEGTYNAFGSSGTVVENPRHAVRLADGDEWLGGELSGVGCRDAVDYLLHRTRGVTLGELSDYYEQNGRPDLVVEKDTDDGTETMRFEWDEEGQCYASRQRQGDD